MRFFENCSRRDAVALMLALAGGTVGAQDAYPSKPIRILVPFPPGGGVDILARSVGQKLSENWGVPVLVDNRPGGNTSIAAQATARSASDGYTLFATIDATTVMNPSLYSKLPYDPVKSFAPVTLAVSQPMVIAVTASFPAKTITELLEAMKANPAQANYAFGAIPAQIAGELIKEATGVPLTAVPYKGSAAAAQDVMAGVLPVLIDAVSPALPSIQSGRLRALAVTGSQRSVALPNVPTLAEAGVSGVSMLTWTGFFLPAGTRPDIVSKLHLELVKILAAPEMKARFNGLGLDIIASSPGELSQVIKNDGVKYDRVIRNAGIKVE